MNWNWFKRTPRLDPSRAEFDFYGKKPFSVERIRDCTVLSYKDNLGEDIQWEAYTSVQEHHRLCDEFLKYINSLERNR